VPSRLAALCWTHTHRDLQFKVRMRVGEEQARAAQAYETLADVVSRALGGKGIGGGDGVMHPRNVAELQVALDRVLGRG
jgi:hypothetical protein